MIYNLAGEEAEKDLWIYFCSKRYAVFSRVVSAPDDSGLDLMNPSVLPSHVRTCVRRLRFNSSDLMSVTDVVASTFR